MFAYMLHLIGGCLICFVGNLMLQSSKPVLFFIEQIRLGIPQFAATSYAIRQITSDNYIQQRLMLKQTIISYIFTILLVSLAAFVRVSITIHMLNSMVDPQKSSE